MKAVLLVSHGSYSPKPKQEASLLADSISHHLPGTMVEYAFLEIEHPTIPEGIDQCVTKGATQIIVTLNFLNSGRHVSGDIPSILAQARNKYPQVKFSITEPIGQHAKLPELFIDLINNA